MASSNQTDLRSNRKWQKVCDLLRHLSASAKLKISLQSHLTLPLYARNLVRKSVRSLRSSLQSLEMIFCSRNFLPQAKVTLGRKTPSPITLLSNANCNHWISRLTKFRTKIIHSGKNLSLLTTNSYSRCQRNFKTRNRRSKL